MGANSGMPQAGFVSASSYDEIEFPLFGMIDGSRRLCAGVELVAVVPSRVC